MAIFTKNNGISNIAKNGYFALPVRLSRAVMFATLIALLFNLTSCSPNAELVQPESAAEVNHTFSARATAIIDSNSTLKSVATFPIGAAVGARLIAQNRKAADVLAQQFNAKTVYAYMNVEPTRGTFNFGESDYWVKYARTHSVRLHGHCLVYHTGAPTWITQFKGTTAEFEQAIKTHIQTVVGRYKGKMKSWDVINEITYYNSGAIGQTPFRKMYSDDKSYLEFVKRCFQWAHEADPDALLFYNDALYEGSLSKVERIVAMVEDFKRNGTPIHGLGTQMHIDINTSNAGIRNSLLRLAATGLLIHVSELDVSVNPNKDQNMVISGSVKEAQRVKYQAVASMYKQIVPPSLAYGITLWDLSDADSWLVVQKNRVEAPCVFDATYNKKPAFYGLIEGLMN